MKTLKCKIKKYDVTKKEPPYSFITLGEFNIIDPEIEDWGVEKARRLDVECLKQGHRMQFYSASSDYGFDFDVVVHLSREEWPHCWDGRFGCYCDEQTADLEPEGGY